MVSTAACNDNTFHPGQPTRRRALLVCKQPGTTDLLAGKAPSRKLALVEAHTSAEALLIAQSHTIDMVLVQCGADHGYALDLVELLAGSLPALPIVLACSQPRTQLTRAAMRYGACDVVKTPLDTQKLQLVLDRNAERARFQLSRDQQRDMRVKGQSIRALAGAVDARESATAHHSRRVAAMVQALALQMQLPPDEAHRLELAAIVHDVGKIGIPDSILLKPGPLTDEEWTVMKTHSATGADIVSHVDELGDVACVVRHHHERVDGAGYPYGLCGDEIPFHSRVIAIADAFEVMTSDRIYRQRIGLAPALQVLRQNAGTQFDSELVDQFCVLGSAGGANGALLAGADQGR